MRTCDDQYGCWQVPFIGSTGNHEEEQEADGSIFKSVQARWPVNQTPPLTPLYFLAHALTCTHLPNTHTVSLLSVSIE